MMKIKSVKDAVFVSNKIIEALVTERKLTQFMLNVDHGDGEVSSCSVNPTGKAKQGQSFLATGDYTKILVLLLTHPRVKNIEYDERRQTVFAWFSAPEMEEVEQLEHEEF
jgi:hypothetical protein